MTKQLKIYYTPKDWDELLAWINRHPDNQRSSLTTAAGQGYNLAISIKEQEENK